MKFRQLVGSLVPLALLFPHVLLYLRHVNDDAYITFRYSRFLASGLGPYFNVGEHVEGYSNFLLMLLMAPVYAIGGEAAVPIVAKWLGIFAGAGALVLGCDLARRLAVASGTSDATAIVTGALAASLVAVFPGFALNCTSGLETGLFGLLIALATWCGLRTVPDGRWRGAGAVWAAAALTRPEAVLIFAVWWLTTALAHVGEFRDRRHLRRLAWDAAIVIAVVGLQVVFRLLVYDGEWLPNTYYAKFGGYAGRDAIDYIRSGALRPFLGVVGVALGLVGWVSAGRGLVRRRTEERASANTPLRPAIPVAVVGVVGLALPLWTGTDWMPGWRFSVPYLVPMAAIIVVGWLRLVSLIRALPRFRGWGHSMDVVAVISVLLVAAGLHHGERQELADRINLRADGYTTGHEALATWIHEETKRPGETIALMDIGIVGYRCPDVRILDITGLTDRFVAKQPGPLLAKLYDPAYILDQAPIWIVLALTAPGDCRTPLPPTASLRTWTGIEDRLRRHPDFVSHYRHRRPVTPEMRHWTDQLAARLGAVRVFEHAHPGQYYLLAVFESAER